MTPHHLADVLACEERLVNCWPALDTLLMDGWVVRFANGYSGRANSASAVRIGARMDGALLREVEGFFRGRGLPPAIRVTPLAEDGLAERLVTAGWRAVTHSLGMIGPATSAPTGSSGIVLDAVPPDEWVQGISVLQEARKRNPEHLAAIVTRIRRPARFATYRVEGRPMAFGMCVLDRGLAEIGAIMVHPDLRGQGIGRGLVTQLIGWAADAGASRVFLQVEAGNAVARGLYASLGLSDLYAYTEYRLVP